MAYSVTFNVCVRLSVVRARKKGGVEGVSDVFTRALAIFVVSACVLRFKGVPISGVM